MKELYLNNNCNTLDLNSIEIYNENVESIFSLTESNDNVKDILNSFAELNIVKKYVFKAPIVEYSKLDYWYKIKLMILLKCNFEYTEESTLGETKFLCKTKLFNVTFTLPKSYEDGMHVNIIPSVVDLSYKILNKNSLYVSSYLSFTAAV